MSNSEQFSLFNEETKSNELVVCLGMTFESEEARRQYFREELRKKLPELKEIEGFPIGEDEDIIALSDPPYYTACPNPWINDFIEEWEKEKVTKYGRDVNEEYHREPFAADVSEGKNDPIYNAHSYHTKVPYKAIIRYMLHYTNPGDIILDSFSGTGMTGVAGEKCNDESILEEMGFVLEGDKILIENEGFVAKKGPRRVILNDLSPAATFITNNYNSSFESDVFIESTTRILEKVEKELGWMFETIHVIDGKVQLDLQGNPIIGKINYLVYTDIFLCPTCTHDINFWDSAVDIVNGKVKDNFECLKCGALLSKKGLQRKFSSYYDEKINKNLEFAVQIPIRINYSIGSKRFEKVLDDYDMETLKKIEEYNIPYWYPTDELKDGYNTKQPKESHNLTHVHHFYFKANLAWLAALKYYSDDNHVYLNTHSIINTITKLYRYVVKKPDYKGQGGGILSGTLYVPSLIRCLSAPSSYKRSINRLAKMFNGNNNINNRVISTGDSSSLKIPSNSIDYIFIDPPFGSNLMYSELNFIWESWLKVRTNDKKEAIENSVQNKSLDDYKELMYGCFKEAYRLLKPNKWITVEFSNSKASVWNAIQEAMQKAGFIVANVAALDKKQGSFKAVTSTTAVKQDLVISAYKPSEENISKMRAELNTPASAWTFVNQHLEKLPVFLGSKGEASIVSERTPRILFDRMVAYHVQNGLPVPISSAEFQEGVTQRFPMRDGMAFLESQVAEYDKKRTLVKEFSQMSLFVSDENSAIEWIRQQLLKKPQTRQDLHPQFMKEIQHIAKHEQLPELDSLLAQNFLRYEGGEAVPNQIATYLRGNYPDLRGLENNDSKLQDKAMNRWYVPDPNKQADLEKLREKALLREFDSYVEELGSHKKKLKVFRTEAIRAGFKKAWSEKDYAKIVTVGDRLPESVIQEDDKLLMYYDNAQIRLDM